MSWLRRSPPSSTPRNRSSYRNSATVTYVPRAVTSSRRRTSSTGVRSGRSTTVCMHCLNGSASSPNCLSSQAITRRTRPSRIRTCRAPLTALSPRTAGPQPRSTHLVAGAGGRCLALDDREQGQGNLGVNYVDVFAFRMNDARDQIRMSMASPVLAFGEDGAGSNEGDRFRGR